MNDLAYVFRLFIVSIGKNVPFILIILLLICNIEGLYSHSMQRYVDVGDGTLMLDNSISWFISNYFSYDCLTIIILASLSFGLKCCWRNKIAIVYLIYNLVQKHIIESMCIDADSIPYILIPNIIVMFIILFLGLHLLYINIREKRRCAKKKS